MIDQGIQKTLRVQGRSKVLKHPFLYDISWGSVCASILSGLCFLLLEPGKGRKVCGVLGRSTLPETNIAPENQWLEDECPLGMAYFQGIC